MCDTDSRLVPNGPKTYACNTRQMSNAWISPPLSLEGNGDEIQNGNGNRTNGNCSIACITAYVKGKYFMEDNSHDYFETCGPVDYFRE